MYFRYFTRICPAGQKATSVVFSKDCFSRFLKIFGSIFWSKKQHFRFFGDFLWFSFFRFSTFSIFLKFSFFFGRDCRTFFESKIFRRSKIFDRKIFSIEHFSEHIFSNPEKYSLPLFLTHSTHCTANLGPCREIRSSDLLVVLNRRRSLWHSLCRLYWV